MEAPRRRRLRMRWPAVPAPQFDSPRRWNWQFEDDRGSEVGRWTITRVGSTERKLAAPELPPAWSTGFAVGADFALVRASTPDGYTLHELRPDHPARLVYRTSTRFAVGGLSRDETWVCIEHADHGDWYHPALRVLARDGEPVADLWDGPGFGLWAGAWSPQPGEHDTRCPIRQIVTYVARLQQRDKPYALYRMAWGHFMWDTDERLRQAEARIDFVARTLETAAPS